MNSDEAEKAIKQTMAFNGHVGYQYRRTSKEMLQVSRNGRCVDVSLNLARASEEGLTKTIEWITRTLGSNGA